MTPKNGHLTLKLLPVLFTLILTGLCLPVIFASPDEASDPPVHVHLGWNDSDASHTMTITWQTNTPSSGNLVLYDTVPRGSIEEYTYQEEGTNHTYRYASGHIHVVELTDLAPDTTYYFVCGGSEGGYSEERSFHTAPAIPSKIRFVIGGDSRSQPAIRDDVSKAAAKLDPAFIVHTGDFVDMGGDQRLWNDWFTSMDELWVGPSGLTIPVIPVHGNHEQHAHHYLAQFPLPGEGYWYSVDYGPTLHIVVLDSEQDDLDEQAAWLDEDLSSHSDSTWKIVAVHRPLLSASEHGGDPKLVEKIAPVLDKHHVDVVFSGHDHDYERTYPVNFTASSTSPQPSPENGTIYIVSAGWGAPLYESGKDWWTAYSDSLYHFTLVTIYPNNTLHLEAIDLEGKTFDQASIVKPPTVFTVYTVVVTEKSVSTQTVTATATRSTTMFSTATVTETSQTEVVYTSLSTLTYTTTTRETGTVTAPTKDEQQIFLQIVVFLVIGVAIGATSIYLLKPRIKRST